MPFALHLAALTNYGFFRDELYFIVCGRHPAFGYIDQPPLVPLLAAASQSAGESLWLLRIIPALFHAGAVLAACAVARLLGGGRSAQVLTGLATGTSTVLLGLTATLGTTALEPLSWTLVAYCALRAVLRDEPRWWIAAGIAGGIALEDKYTVAFLLAALVTGLLLAGPRATLGRRAFWLGAFAAVVLAAPSLIWQTAHGWPFIELLRNGANGKNTVAPPGSWLIGQVLIVGPLWAPLWLTGLGILLTRPRLRFAGIAALGLFAAFIALHAKDYYLAGIYPLLFAAGATGLERGIRSAGLRHAYAVVAAAAALAFAPLGLPLLPEPVFIGYAAALARSLHVGVQESEKHQRAPLPQYFADMHGWRELADRVAVVERTLTPQERAQAAVFTQNYGEAAAVDVFGDRELPVICGHNSYALWGSHGPHSVLIIVGGEKADYERTFRDVRRVEVVHSAYAMPYENDLPIYVAKAPRMDFETIWRHAKFID